MLVKNILIKSSDSANSVESSFFNDIELVIIIESTADSKDEPLKVVFFTLKNDIKELVRGYFGIFFDFKFKGIDERQITIQTTLTSDEILAKLSQKDIIKSCEQIILNDAKISDTAITMPFNDSRAKISSAFLRENSDFFCDELWGKSCDSSDFLRGNLGESSDFLQGDSSDFFRSDSANETMSDSAKDSAILKECGVLYRVKIPSHKVESFDTNPQNAIYKAIGKAWNRSEKSKDLSKMHFNLLDSTILLNFRLEMESLKILLLYKCTFVICSKKPSFSVIKNAQKFGMTLIAFDNDRFLILTHTARFSH